MLKDSIPENSPCILVEGPRWGDAAFYGKWLIGAGKANTLWEKAYKDPSFRKAVERLTVDYIPHFGILATVLLSYLEGNYYSFVVPVHNEMEGEVFTMMVEMGFFVLTGQRYQMVIPSRLTIGKVKKAALKLAQTEDHEYYLHPEHLVAAMPYAEAKTWQARLRHMDENHRCADRHLLLETPSDFKIARPAALKVRPEN